MLLRYLRLLLVLMTRLPSESQKLGPQPFTVVGMHTYEPPVSCRKILPLAFKLPIRQVWVTTVNFLVLPGELLHPIHAGQ